MEISIEYLTDMPGVMQLYHTTDEDDNYVPYKVNEVQISGAGTAVFDIPITQFTRLRLDTPREVTWLLIHLKLLAQ